MSEIVGTTIVNVWGGPGIGKSTTAAEVYVLLKKLGMNVELAHEYAKARVYRQHPIKKYDELYTFAKQLHIESPMYGKVAYIVADRPVAMSAVYARVCDDRTGVAAAVERCIAEQKRDGIMHVDFILKRSVKYNPEGRFHTEEQAHEIDRLCREYRPDLIEVTSAQDILYHLGVE
jgi:hypothetical protein